MLPRMMPVLGLLASGTMSKRRCRWFPELPRAWILLFRYSRQVSAQFLVAAAVANIRSVARSGPTSSTLRLAKMALPATFLAFLMPYIRRTGQSLEDHLHRDPGRMARDGHGEHLRVIVTGVTGRCCGPYSWWWSAHRGKFHTLKVGPSESVRRFRRRCFTWHAGVELADDIGLQEGGHAGQILHVHLVDDGPAAAAQGSRMLRRPRWAGPGFRSIVVIDFPPGMTKRACRTSWTENVTSWPLHQVVALPAALSLSLGRVTLPFSMNLPVLLLNFCLFRSLSISPLRSLHLVHLWPGTPPASHPSGETLSLFPPE